MGKGNRFNSTCLARRSKPNVEDSFSMNQHILRQETATVWAALSS
jgi:hypothetical protein